MAIFGHTLYVVIDKYGNTAMTNRENVMAYPNDCDARKHAAHLDRKEWDAAPHQVIVMERKSPSAGGV